jgi:hypothetical protein
LNLEVGIYTNLTDESTFIQLAQFGNKFRVGGTSSQTFTPNINYPIPPTYEGAEVFVRVTYVNTGVNAASVLVNLLGLK